MKRSTHPAYMEAEKYIRRIRNDGKRAYARACLQNWLDCTAEPAESNLFGIGAMAAQAVRNQLAEIWDKHTSTEDTICRADEIEAT